MVFEYYALPINEVEAKIFSTFLASYRNARIPWTSMYMTEEIVDGHTGGPLLVEIGGNHGDDLESFRSKHPGKEKQMFLEDMPAVLEKATCAAEIHRTPHDLFRTQPTKGARAYYMHSILHDYNDEDALVILGHVKDAMIPGYSKLLIIDMMLPPSGPSRLEMAVDLQMLVMVAGKERTEEMFGQMFAKAGIRVVKIWRHPSSVTSIAELAVVGL